MNRKRLLSILSAAALSVAALAGPAAALEAPGGLAETNDDTITVEADGLEAELDTDDTEARVELLEEDVTLAPTDAEEPVKTSDDGSDEELTDPVTDALEGDDDTTPEPGGESGGDATGSDDVRTAGDDTVAAPSPYEREHASSPAKVTPSQRHHFAFGTQRPAPASAVAEPEVAAPAELSPEVAPPRTDETEVVNLATTPISDPASAPTGLKILATMLVAGTALTWWNTREVIAETVR